MTKKKDKEEPEEKDEGISIDFGLGGLFKGLGNLIDTATRLAEKGEEISRTGEIRFSGLEKIKGIKDLKGVYGVRVSTMADGRPSVQPFGNIKKTPKGPVVEEVREPLVDVFDEEDHLLIVAELPGVEKNDVHTEIKGDILILKAEKGERKYSKEVLLPSAVDVNTLESSFKNGILEIKLMKAGR